MVTGLLEGKTIPKKPSATFAEVGYSGTSSLQETEVNCEIIYMHWRESIVSFGLEAVNPGLEAVSYGFPASIGK